MCAIIEKFRIRSALYSNVAEELVASVVPVVVRVVDHRFVHGFAASTLSEDKVLGET